MDKEYMINQLNIRLKDMQAEYRSYFSGSSENANRVKRTKKKRDIGIANLLLCLLSHCPDDLEINDPELLHVFARLVEPRRINL